MDNNMVIWIVIGVVGSFITGIIASAIGTRRGSFLLGFFLGIIGIIIAVLINPKDENIIRINSTPDYRGERKIETNVNKGCEKSSLREKRSCPKCGKMIYATARYCTYCGEKII